ncbi:hypothetical protein [Edwardsiella tarda]|uniref:Uncharacterized protein n=1 Tax=Edwardsiella tarda ATCC 15947 = NBRC 105688 TaxID=667121 RepID=A0AC61THY0_EDWTA|nr:hypothetical protein [Edwardsiella tarda]UAL56668.1 hypothetical protein K8O98_01430 [Edwardsiella tarda]UCQ00279.1 hypothetical protein DCL27_00235 [Edwardsiella tarda ATCC 15947 = NBRC 105688]
MSSKKVKQEIKTIKRLIAIAGRRLDEGNYDVVVTLLREVTIQAGETAERIESYIQSK